MSETPQWLVGSGSRGRLYFEIVRQSPLSTLCNSDEVGVKLFSNAGTGLCKCEIKLAALAALRKIFYIELIGEGEIAI